jgi:glutamine synthetase
MDLPILDDADAATLLAMPDCQAIDLLLPDMNGVLRGKRVARDALEKVYAQGVSLPMSLIATDITGNTVEETGLGYAIGDEDRTCRPVPGSLRPVPWQDRGMAQLLLAMEDVDGKPFEANPRAVLARVLQRFAARGLTPVVAIELEFYLLDAELAPDGSPRTSVNPATGQRNTSTQVYHMQDLDDYGDFTRAVGEACRAQGIPADTAVAEYAPGQFEINLSHRADALLACDDAIYLKRAIKAIAQRQGMLASFMAKPFAGQAGSGLHVHASVLDPKGRNIFAGTPEAPADALRHAVGGLQRISKDCMLLFAPHANSYRRFVMNAFVPLNDAWASTTARWRCASRTATRPTCASSTASPAPMPIPTSWPRRCWPASCAASTSAPIPARRSSATPTSRSRRARRSGRTRSRTSSRANSSPPPSARASGTSSASRSARRCARSIRA